jgi:hypothetical protein
MAIPRLGKRQHGVHHSLAGLGLVHHAAGQKRTAAAQRLPSATVFGCHVHGCSGLNTAKAATRVAGFK